MKKSIGWTGIIAIAAVFSIQLGAIYWLNNNMQAGFESVNEEFGRVRDEISDLRNHTLAEIGLLRSEVGEISERMIRSEMLFQNLLSSAP